MNFYIFTYAFKACFFQLIFGIVISTQNIYSTFPLDNYSKQLSIFETHQLLSMCGVNFKVQQLKLNPRLIIELMIVKILPIKVL